MLSFRIKDLKNQEVIGKFSDVMTFAKMDFKTPVDLSKEISGKLYKIEIVWQNSRKTRITCHEDEYRKFYNNWEKYTEWLEENPDLEQSRLDMGILNEVLKKAILSSADEVAKVGEQIKDNLVELNEQLESKLVEREEVFIKKTADKINVMDERSQSLVRQMDSVEKAIRVITEFMPDEAKIQERELDTRALNKEVSEE